MFGEVVGEEFRTAPIDETMGVYNEETFGRSSVPFSGVVPLLLTRVTYLLKATKKLYKKMPTIKALT